MSLVSQLFLGTACVFGEAPTSPAVAWQTKPESTWVYGMLTRNDEKMHELLDDSIRYVHVTGSVTESVAFRISRRIFTVAANMAAA